MTEQEFNTAMTQAARQVRSLEKELERLRGEVAALREERDALKESNQRLQSMRVGLADELQKSREERVKAAAESLAEVQRLTEALQTARLSDAHSWEIERHLERIRRDDAGNFPLIQALEAALSTAGEEK